MIYVRISTGFVTVRSITSVGAYFITFSTILLKISVFRFNRSIRVSPTFWFTPAGSGTVLDTSRLKYLISKHTGIDARYCHTYIIGEHGDSEVAAWSITNIAGMSMKSFFEHYGKCTDEDLQAMYSEVKNSAYEIIQKKGATYYAIATAVARIVECISGGENSVLTISSVLNGEYGIEDISLSVPTQVSGYGVERILDVPFNETELQGLRSSAKTLKDSLKSIGF